MAKWELIVKEWVFDCFQDKARENHNDWFIFKLVQQLVKQKIIPSHIQHDDTLYSLLHAQINKCVSEMLILPAYGFVHSRQRIQRRKHKNKFTGHLQSIVEKLREKLESETGINIKYYSRIESVAQRRYCSIVV